MKPGWDYPHSRQTTEGQQDWFPMKARVSMSSLIIIVAIVYLSLFHALDCLSIRPKEEERIHEQQLNWFGMLEALHGLEEDPDVHKNERDGIDRAARMPTR